MQGRSPSQTDGDGLRRAAEAQLGDVQRDGSIEEQLRAHEAELEIQSEGRRHSEAELEYSRRQFFELYDLAPVGYLTLTSRGEIRRSNVAAAAMLGADRAMLDGTPLAVYLDAASRPAFYQHMATALECGFGRACDVQLSPPRAGAEAAVKCVQLTSTRAEDGSERQILLTLTDITDRVRAESALRHREARLRVISNQAPLAIALIDPAGGLLESNEAWGEILDGTRLAIGDVIFDAFVEGRDLARMLQVGDRPLGPVEMHVRETGRPISIRASRISTSAPSAEGEWILMVSDLSDRRRAEERAEGLKWKLRIAQQERLRALGELAGGIAHDFNNSLAAILSGAESAALAEQLPEEIAEDLRLVREAALGARALVRRILAFARPGDTREERFDLRDAVAHNFALVRAAAPSGVRMTLGELTSMPIHGRRAQIDQVLVNVLTNAVQACDKANGRVDVETRRIDTTAKEVQEAHLEGDSFFEIAITDDGVGINSETLTRIFDPYFTTRRENSGTGFGLATAHGIVGSHGGVLDVDSRLGSGSTFRIILPSTPEAASDETRAPAKRIRHDLPVAHGARILVVDDESGVRETCRHLLEHLGAEVTVCETADEALAVIAVDPKGLDLVITDLTMPRRSGLWLVRNVRGLAPELPIVLLTGNQSRIDPQELAASRPDALLEKPLTLEELSALVTEHVAMAPAELD